MKQYLETHLYIALTLFLFGSALVLGAFIADRNQKDIEIAIRKVLEERASYMLSLAEVTDRNGADAEVGAVLKDCERRAEFESLLIKLGTLTKKDLILAQNLFDGCGRFHAEQKSLMTQKLEHEFRFYTESLSLLKTLTEKDIEQYREDVWRDIITNEGLRSGLLQDLTGIQGQIISELISGVSVQGGTVTSLVSRAQDIGELLMVYDQKIDESRRIVKQ